MPCSSAQKCITLSVQRQKGVTDRDLQIQLDPFVSQLNTVSIERKKGLTASHFYIYSQILLPLNLHIILYFKATLWNPSSLCELLLYMHFFEKVLCIIRHEVLQSIGRNFSWSQNFVALFVALFGWERLIRYPNHQQARNVEIVERAMQRFLPWPIIFL